MVLQTESATVFFTALVLALLIPVKISASLFGAKHDSFLYSLLAIALAIPTAYITNEFIVPGLIGVYFAVVITVFIVLRTSISGAFIIPVFALLISMAIFQGLSSFGLIEFTAT